MKTRQLPTLLSAACIMACATTPTDPELRLKGSVEVDGDTLHFPAKTVSASSKKAIEHAVMTRCSTTPCEVVYADLPLTMQAKHLEKLSTALKDVSSEVHLLPPSDRKITLIRSADACEAELYVERDAFYLMVDGHHARPDECDPWGATACLLDDGSYDWPRLRSALGRLEVLCLSLGAATGEELIQIHEIAGQPDIFLTSRPRREGKLDSEDVDAALRGAKSDLEWCKREADAGSTPTDVVVKFLVEDSGKVTRVEMVSATRSSPQFELCVLDAIKKLRIENPPSMPVVVERSL